MEKSKVYFTKNIDSKSLIKMFEVLEVELSGKIMLKLHSGERGNKNYLKPDFVKDLIYKLNGTVVECNTAYEGMRDTTDKHKILLKEHGWSNEFNVDLLDEEGDIVFDIPEGKVIKKNYVGKNILNYDSCLVLSHFKGHPMGGYGGALKQLSIGFASSKGKRYIHCAGKENGSYDDMFNVKQENFLEAMADAAKSIVDKFKNNIVYINVMCDVSVDCDCCDNAKDPCMADIGILSSTDPVAIDQTCIDLIYNSKDPGKDELIERIESRKGLHVIESAYNLGIGNKYYDLINIDNE